MELGEETGTITRKHATYDVSSATPGVDRAAGGAEEMQSISCLLPRQADQGTLYKGKYLHLTYTHTHAPSLPFQHQCQ